MKKILISKELNHYKANLHCHTTYSDGHKTPEEVKDIYKKLGYSVVAYTDHDILIPHDDLTDDEFLALHGFEVEINDSKPGAFGGIKCCHICFIGIDKDNITQPLWHREKYLFANAPKYKHLVKFDESEPDYEREYTSERISDMMQKARAKGFFVTYNHPAWSMETTGEYLNYSGMHAMEIMNGSCICDGYDDYNSHEYDAILRNGNKIYCIGADDNHDRADEGMRHFDSGVAYTVIQAENLEYCTITKALENGCFYASEGPEIKSLSYEDGKVYVECSEADIVQINTGVRYSARKFREKGEKAITQAVFDVPDSVGYFRITVIDSNGKRAYTNAYFLSELNESK